MCSPTAPLRALTGTSADLRADLIQFYNFMFSNAFLVTTGWLYSTPSVTFKWRDPNFNNEPTATLIAENIYDVFICNAAGQRIKSVGRNTFTHTFCLDESGNDAVWKICRFYELNRFGYEQNDTLYTHTYP
jgi:hypothetical protein